MSNKRKIMEKIITQPKKILKIFSQKNNNRENHNLEKMNNFS